jgi:hypothetical protein
VSSNGHAATIADPSSVRLAPGAHSSPREGACVVELASILAGEEFSDRPRCVDPVIAAFLRGWNDRAGHADRQRLRPYAERIVGSRGSRRLTRERRELCLQWAEADRGGSRPTTRALTRIRIAVYCGLPAAFRIDEGAGDYAARVSFSRGDQEAVFKLLDVLLARDTGQPGQPQNGSAPRPGRNGGTDRGANGNGLATGNGAGHRSLNGEGRGARNGNGSVPSRDRPVTRPRTQPPR